MKLENEETKTVKQFIVIFLVVLVIVGAIYLLTSKVVKKDDNTTRSNDSGNVSNLIDPTVAIVGTMLKKGTGTYYVLLYDTTKEDASTYARLLSSYSNTKNAITTYTVDLSNPLNSKYVATDDKTNPTTSNLADLRFGAVTLLKVKDNKITNAYETVEKIKSEWKITD